MQQQSIDPQDQKELQETINAMVKTFNDFHTKMIHLKKEQRQVIEVIRNSVDQQKIEQIKQLLQQVD